MPRLIRCAVILATVAVFAATFFLPITRETQILICRLLLRCPAENTKLSAASPAQPVPYSRFSESFRNQLRAAQGRSADAYLLAQSAGPAISAFPPPAEWTSNPLARWAAMHEAGRISFLLSTERASTQPESGDRVSPAAVENTLETIRMLQTAHPQEGGLWLAGAVVLFAREENASAVQAVWSAINRDRWMTTRDECFEPVRRLLQSAGLPRLEASQLASWNWPDPQPLLLMNAGRCLVAMTAKAVCAGEHRRVDELFVTMAALGRTARESIEFGLDIENSSSFDELVSAMAERMGRAPPIRDWDSDYESWQKVRRQILTEYLDNWVDPEAAAFFREEHAREQEAA